MLKPALTLFAVLSLAPAAFASGDGEPRFWNAPSFTLHVGLGGGGTSPKAMLEVLEASAEAWNRVGTGPEIVVDGAFTRVREPVADGVNAVFFYQGEWPWDPNEIALTFSHVRSGTREVREVDIAINATHHKFGKQPGAFDLQNVITHELGHALGLRHLHDEPEATMYPTITHGEQKKRDLDLSDEVALLSLYEAIDLSGPAYGCSSSGPASEAPLFAAGLLLLALPRLRRRARR